MSTSIRLTSINLLYLPLFEERNMTLDSFESNFLSLAGYQTGWADMAVTPNILADMRIRVTLSDGLVFDPSLPYNYAAIRVNTGTLPLPNYDYFFFYVRRFSRVSNTVADVELHIDSLNTYSWESLLTDRTFIKREHRDRYRRLSGKYVPIVDKVSEGINAPKYRKKSADFLYPMSSINDRKWYLIYRSADVASDYTSSNAVTCSTICQKALKISDASSSGTGSDVSLYRADLALGMNYYLTEDDSPEFSLTCDQTNQTYTNNPNDASRCFMIAFTSTGIYAYYGQPQNIESRSLITNVAAATFTVHKATFMRVLSSPSTDYSIITASPTTYALNAGTTSVDSVYSKDFGSLDRSDPKIVKVIELPYPPKEVTLSSGHYSVDGFTFDQASQEYVLDNNNTAFKSAVELASLDSDFFPLAVGSLPGVDNSRIMRDPKLWNSEITSIALRYDSFAYQVKYECFDFDAVDAGKEAYTFSIEFIPSSDISSASLFHIVPSSSQTTIKDDLEYSGYFVSGRNNEVTLYSNAYLNYMRTGYNYDVKTKNMQTLSSVVSLAGGIGGSILAGALTGNPALVVAGAATSFAQQAISVAQRETSFSQQIANLQMQSANVSGAGDLSLFGVYGKRLTITNFSVTDDVQHRLDDLFYYCGYARNVYGTPSLNTRAWFNFVQCEPVLSPTREIPKFALDEIADKLRAGVTVFHYRNDQYNLDQDRENLETSLL